MISARRILIVQSLQTAIGASTGASRWRIFTAALMSVTLRRVGLWLATDGNRQYSRPMDGLTAGSERPGSGGCVPVQDPEEFDFVYHSACNPLLARVNPAVSPTVVCPGGHHPGHELLVLSTPTALMRRSREGPVGLTL